MTLDDITRRDPKGMSIWIADFPKQIEQSVRIGKEARIKLNVKGIQNIGTDRIGRFSYRRGFTSFISC